MSKFKVGDIIVGKDSGNNIYSHTAKKKGFVGEVIDTCATEIKVKILKSKTGFIGSCFWVDSEHFKLKKDDSKAIVKAIPPFVYALKDGKVGIAQCRDGDEFDEKFGTKLALARLSNDDVGAKELIEKKYPKEIEHKLFDSRGIELEEGDEVVYISEETGRTFTGEVVFEYVLHLEKTELFVTGIESSCNDETGEITNWEVYKLAKK